MSDMGVLEAADEFQPLFPHPVEVAILLVSVLLLLGTILLIISLVRRSRADGGPSGRTGRSGGPSSP